jgi:hypothetical protein
MLNHAIQFGLLSTLSGSLQFGGAILEQAGDSQSSLNESIVFGTGVFYRPDEMGNVDRNQRLISRYFRGTHSSDSLG